MSLERDWNTEMPRVPIDDSTADRLLSGRMSPADAPPGYAGVAALVGAAVAAARPSELLSETSVVSQAVEAVSGSPLAPSDPRSKPLMSKLRTAKFAAVAPMIAILAAGTAAAAATGTLPGQSHANKHAASGLARAASHHASSGSPGASNNSAGTVSTANGAIPATGMANQHAQFGLCTAFLAGGGNDSSASTGAPSTGASPTPTSEPHKYSAPPFQALIKQNGGSVGATTTYCQGVVKSHPSDSADTPDNGAQSSKPGDAGKNSGTSGHPPVSTPNSGGTGTADTASGGASTSGTGTANTSSGGASSAGSGNAPAQH